MNIQKMNDGDCMTLIRSQRTGRLGCCKDGRPYVVPVHYVCADALVFSFSMPGRKLDFMRSNPNVCFEVENIEQSDKWKCAVIEGIFHEFTTEEDKQRAWEVLQEHNDWWEVGGQTVQHGEHDGDRKPIFFSISMDIVTGREAVST
jgi:nitroimidazol reductase NimA-like FMN-containing flavoprotein (pyridoxamine 5'-phosphate oxidase superfamily)